MSTHTVVIQLKLTVLPPRRIQFSRRFYHRRILYYIILASDVINYKKVYVIFSIAVDSGCPVPRRLPWGDDRPNTD